MDTLEKEKVNLSKNDLQKLLQAYQIIGSFLAGQKKKKLVQVSQSLKTLYGVWKGVKVNEDDFSVVKKSLFKNSL